MPDERVPADYTDMAISEAQQFDKMVKENFMPAIVSTAKQIIDDYGVLEGVCLEVGCGTAIFAIELCRRSNLKLSRTLRILDNALRIPSAGCSARSASQPANSPDKICS